MVFTEENQYPILQLKIYFFKHKNKNFSNKKDYPSRVIINPSIIAAKINNGTIINKKARNEL